MTVTKTLTMTWTCDNERLTHPAVVLCPLLPLPQSSQPQPPVLSVVLLPLTHLADVNLGPPRPLCLPTSLALPLRSAPVTVM